MGDDQGTCAPGFRRGRGLAAGGYLAWLAVATGVAVTMPVHLWVTVAAHPGHTRGGGGSHSWSPQFYGGRLVTSSVFAGAAGPGQQLRAGLRGDLSRPTPLPPRLVGAGPRGGGSAVEGDKCAVWSRRRVVHRFRASPAGERPMRSEALG